MTTQNQLLEAAALCARLDLIHKNPQYKAVWDSARVHGATHDGQPTYEHELKALKAAVEVMRPTPQLKPATALSLVFEGMSGSIYEQLETLMQELESLAFLSGDYLAGDHRLRDAIADLVGRAQDCFIKEEGDSEERGDEVSEDADSVIAEIIEMLQTFAPPFCDFGNRSRERGKLELGFWPQAIEYIKEQIDFCSSEDAEYPPEEYLGEWLHINDHGNCTLYVRTPAVEAEDEKIWSIV